MNSTIDWFYRWLYMNFFQDNVEKEGMKALNLTSEFDEKDVMETFKKYLTATLDVSNNYNPPSPPPLQSPKSHIRV